MTGATGVLGPTVVTTLLRAGYRVRTLSLHRPEASPFPGAVEAHSGDITDRNTLDEAVVGAGAVLHLAALLHIQNPSAGLRSEYERINVRGTSGVIDAALRHGVRRVIFFSTIAVYGDGRREMLTEESTPHSTTYYTETKLAAERIVLSARRPDGAPLGTVLRLGAVYGSRVRGSYERLVRGLARGWFVPVGPGLNRRTLVYDKDVAAAAILAVEHPAAGGRVYNVTDGHVHRFCEIIQAICEALGRRPPVFSLPVTPTRLAFGLLENAASVLGWRSPLNRAMLDKYLEDVAVDGSKIQREIGFIPQYNLASGWQETIQEMRRAGNLE